MPKVFTPVVGVCGEFGGINHKVLHIRVARIRDVMMYQPRAGVDGGVVAVMKTISDGLEPPASCAPFV